MIGVSSGSAVGVQRTPSLVASSLAFAKITAEQILLRDSDRRREVLLGANSIGQIGDGGKICTATCSCRAPQQVVGGKKVPERVTLGNQFACAVTTRARDTAGRNNSKLGNGRNASTRRRPCKSRADAVPVDLVRLRSLVRARRRRSRCTVGTQRFGAARFGVANGIDAGARGGAIRRDRGCREGIGTGSGAHSCAISANVSPVCVWGRNDTGRSEWVDDGRRQRES
jgi:hypothetical protein